MKRINLQIIKKRVYSLHYLTFFIAIVVASSCKKELNQINPNAPTLAGNVTNEAGVTAYASGGVYWNGFNYGDVWLGNSYFSLPWGYHELMGDVVGGGAGSNNQTTTMGVPDSFTPDPVGAPGTVVVNPSPQVTIIRNYNNAASTAAANNPLYYEWLNMYSMINVMNSVLLQLPNVTDLSAGKVSTVQAWCYWWKGYAYAQIGTLYYAGLIEDEPNVINNKFVSHDDIIAESNKQLNNALGALQGINGGEYDDIISKLIPQQCQVGLGFALSSAQWIKTINTMLARNILFNKLAPFVNGNPAATITGASIPAISATDWNSIITYCTAGVQKDDYVFTGRSTTTNSFFTATSGSVASLCAQSNHNSTYKVSERIVQQFQAGDARLANFTDADGIFTGDASTNSTRYSLVDGVDAGLSGIPILGSKAPGGIEIYIGPTYEENALMLAEAYIQTGQIEQGLALIDEVRAYQGAALPAVTGTGLNLSQALTVLCQERLAALAFRGLSFYDLRRWGWTYGASKGGGRWGCNLIYQSTLYTNAYINYNYMDYWDVNADETDKNTSSEDSAPVKNPNY